MTILSSSAVRAPLGLSGSMFGVALKTFLQASHYNIQAIDDALAFIDANGTATGSVLDADHQAEANLIIMQRTGATEHESAEDWAGVWDEEVWGLTDAPDPWTDTPLEPLSTPEPVRHEWAAPFQPSPADRRYWAEVRDREERRDRRADHMADEAHALELMTIGLDAMPALCGGSPADSKPIRLRDWDDKTGVRSRPQSNIRDEDVITATGCCG